MKKIFVISAAIFVFLLIFILLQRREADQKYSPFGNVLEMISINGNVLEMETVSTPEKIALGLSGRELMCENCGMLFVFDQEDYRRFWMKDMKFDLDILWIAGDSVVYVARNVPHKKGTGEVVSPGIKADKVLELNAGMIDKLGIKVGNRIEL